MSKIIPSHGTPSGSVFGIIGNLIGTDEGSVYIKYQDDTLNTGWGDPGETPAIPTPTPTPTPSNRPPDLFSTRQIHATGSSKCNNECRLEWITDSETSLSFRVSWDRSTSVSDPVLVMGTASSSSLMNGTSEYNGSVFSAPTGKYWLSFSRPSSNIDNVRFNISVDGGAITSARLISYTSGSSTIASLTAERISGNYMYHIRNLSGNLSNGTGGIIEFASSPTQTISVTGSNNNQSVELLEILGYSESLYFTPSELKLCSALPSTPTPTPTITTTPTITPSISPTSTPSSTPFLSGTLPATPTPTPTITSTVTNTPTQTPSPSSAAGELVWIDYDAYGRAEASWITTDGSQYSTGLLTGTEFTTAIFGQAITLNSLSVKYGANIRYAPIGSPDPRGTSYQIDATTDLLGVYSFDYIDPYNVQRNAAGTSSPSTPVYAVACGRSVVGAIRGTVQISTRLC